MGNFLTANSLFILIACILLGCCYAWVFYQKNYNLNKRLKIILIVIRITVITAISFLIFAPLFKQTSYTLQKPIIIIANDNSISVAQIKPVGFNQKQYERDLKQLSDKLSKKFDVYTYNFSDSVKQGLNFSGKGKLSNGSALVEQLTDKLINRNIGAIILATDGIFNRGGNPLYNLNKIQAPVYTIALGDTIPKKDVLISNVNYNNLVYLNNEFTLDVQIQASEIKGETTQLSIAENGNKIFAQNVNINNNNFVKELPIKIKASKTGIQKYSIAIAPVSNEFTTKNNNQTIFVEVIDARQKILIAAGSPHPDLTAIKQAIELNKQYEVSLVIADDLNEIDIDKYNLAVLYQLPAIGSIASNFLSDVQKSKIPTWYILGAQTNISSFNQHQKSLIFINSNGSIQEVFPNIATNFTTFNLENNAFNQLNKYDPLLVPFGSFTINGSYASLLNQQIGKVKTENPLWFFTDGNEKKLGFLIGEGIWKWKLEEAKSSLNFPLVNDLISKSVQYLSVKDDKRKFKVFNSRNDYEENEDVILNATLYNDAYEPINTPDVKLQIKNEQGKVFNYIFSKIATTYQLNAGNLPEGNYTYKASTVLGDKNYTAIGAFYVNSLGVEYQQTTANHQILYAMSQQTNGKIVMPNNLLQIEDILVQNELIKTISYEERKFEDLINFKWLFVLILFLLSIEWFLRKRNGEA